MSLCRILLISGVQHSDKGLQIPITSIIMNTRLLLDNGPLIKDNLSSWFALYQINNLQKCWSNPTQGWGLLKPRLLISPYANFSILQKYPWNCFNHIHIWQTPHQWSCSDTCQISMISNSYSPTSWAVVTWWQHDRNRGNYLSNPHLYSIKIMEWWVELINGHDIIHEINLIETSGWLQGSFNYMGSL